MSSHRNQAHVVQFQLLGHCLPFLTLQGELATDGEAEDIVNPIVLEQLRLDLHGFLGVISEGIFHDEIEVCKHLEGKVWSDSTVLDQIVKRVHETDA